MHGVKQHNIEFSMVYYVVPMINLITDVYALLFIFGIYCKYNDSAIEGSLLSIMLLVNSILCSNDIVSVLKISLRYSIYKINDEYYRRNIVKNVYCSSFFDFIFRYTLITTYTVCIYLFNYDISILFELMLTQLFIISPYYFCRFVVYLKLKKYIKNKGSISNIYKQYKKTYSNISQNKKNIIYIIKR